MSSYDDGLRIRKEVIGAERVERSIAGATGINLALQQLVTEFAWGKVWSRPQLDRRTRSLVTLAMMSALNRQGELSVHVRGALRNGCTAEEILEVLLQSGIYAGLPAAGDAIRTAQEAITEYEEGE